MAAYVSVEQGSRRARSGRSLRTEGLVHGPYRVVTGLIWTRAASQAGVWSGPHHLRHWHVDSTERPPRDRAYPALPGPISATYQGYVRHGSIPVVEVNVSEKLDSHLRKGFAR